ncbi:hypothetical protein J3U66_01425 [Gilliamella sp. B2969]|uniref:hypothetical protein n=1 Tax=unclassified Gilliamella TaxID=2685620 RepID=UPI00226A36CE|nr:MULTISPECIES: hypothetical protein [unclassified Gilliamella]MCX8711691.1 hypothetical protein [Gilliamella sp. B3468]MCX8727820.1 hypothetical protein [Gilliamella sp. B2838]MCX8729037.1 hypothetical protein [Gilliamella sp. B2969]MCX8739929.1 hypothetical protein [Gilliamella sp. B2824]MCX8750741.1 hypothetical protein [Gilliamella sp. B3464]
MRQLQQLVENSYEASYYKMLDKIEQQDAQEEWIDKRADELMGNFSNENDWQILALLKLKLDNHSVDAKIYHQFIIDICYSQAQFEFKQHSLMLLNKNAY